jgi:hypothetical protein
LNQADLKDLRNRAFPKYTECTYKLFVIPNRAESPMRACPELAEGNLLLLVLTMLPSH